MVLEQLAIHMQKKKIEEEMKENREEEEKKDKSLKVGRRMGHNKTKQNTKKSLSFISQHAQNRILT